MTAHVSLILPIPPSVNAMFSNSKNASGRGRFKTPEYKIWIGLAGHDLKAQRPGKVPGAYALDIFLPPLRGDIDNRIKAASDLLVLHGVIEDDSKAARVAVETVSTITAMHLLVRPWTAVARLADEHEWPWRIAA